MTNYTQAFDFFYMVGTVGNDPVAGNDLRRHGTGILDGDSVGKNKIVLFRVGLVFEVLRRHRYTYFIRCHNFLS